MRMQMIDNSTDPSTDLPTTTADVEPAPLVARAPVRADSPAFSDFDIKPEIVEALAGTGKTLGFGVPLLNRINLPGGEAAAPQALVIAPTRELAVQVSGDLSA